MQDGMRLGQDEHAGQTRAGKVVRRFLNDRRASPLERVDEGCHDAFGSQPGNGGAVAQVYRVEDGPMVLRHGLPSKVLPAQSFKLFKSGRRKSAPPRRFPRQRSATPW
jgi:hypothetical protein